MGDVAENDGIFARAGHRKLGAAEAPRALPRFGFVAGSRRAASRAAALPWGEADLTGSGTQRGPRGAARRVWRRLQTEVRAYRLALADPRTPPAAWWLLRFALIYLLSPLDLIPDAIPVIGFLDDVMLLPGVLFLARRMIPPALWADCRARAAASQ